MTKWEYLFVTCDHFMHHPWSINGEELRDERASMPVPTFVNDLGDQGWELVSAQFQAELSMRGPTAPPTWKLIFKRPKP
ncbi:MAG: DUF4177 domain-containing protein [Chloroflexi bacterium]|nr:DUF4177 domain-containing protein [Chloroflexota bacterium]